MKILVTGASGFIGTELIAFLETKGHQVLRMVRTDAKGAGEIKWDIERGTIENIAALENLYAVVHLAGESVGEGRWTPEKKRRIRDSRLKGTSLIASTLANLKHPPQILACASAIGYYGNRGDEILSEDSPPGAGFLADVCLEWEAATAPAVAAGIRVTNLRFGIVLSQKSGALAKVLTPFQMGAGGKIGTGKQYMSWIAIDDAIAAVDKAINAQELSGAVNIVAPNPITNEEFTKTLGRVLERPTILTVPAFAARLTFGEMADALLLSSARVVPARLQQLGFAFLYPELESTFNYLLSEKKT